MSQSVALGRACDNACLFCAQEGLPREAVDDATLEAQLTAAREAGNRTVMLVGGEPALDPRLEGTIRRAQAMGFQRVGVQTNGVALAKTDRIAALARAGLTHVHLSIHGAEARVHDWHTARAGSFEAAVRTMADARAVGLEVVVATVLTRSNFRVLSPVAKLLVSRGAAAWCIEVPRWRGRTATAPDRVVPRLSLALPFALHALDSARGSGLRAFLRGAPSCLLGPFAAKTLDDVGHAPNATDGRRAFDARCQGCEARPGCSGVDAEYLARFGAEELAPCTPVAREAGREAWAELFPGVGEMAAPAAPPAETSPARARVALPVLGRPSPARAEVSASAPKQSGEALRAILPALFERPAGGEQAKGK